MGYYIENIGGSHNSMTYTGEDQKVSAQTMKFVCDTEADIAKLPTTYIPDEEGRYCAPGSTATVIKPFGVYVLGVTENSWIKI